MPAPDRSAPLVVWVNGAGQGIGRAVAEHLAEAGHTVWATDINGAAVEELAAYLTARGLRAHGFRCDVTDESDVLASAQRIAASGSIDALLNSAGIIHIGGVLDITPEAWRRVMSVNVEGTVLACQAVARIMLTQDVHPELHRRGMIVNIGSPAAERGRPRLAAYGASKAALKHWTMSLGAALEQDYVSVALVYPGMVLDGMYRTILEAEAAMDGRDVNELEAERAALAPGGTYQLPADLGPLVQHMIATPGMSLNRQVLWSTPHFDALA